MPRRKGMARRARGPSERCWTSVRSNQVWCWRRQTSMAAIRLILSCSAVGFTALGETDSRMAARCALEGNNAAQRMAPVAKTVQTRGTLWRSRG